MNYIIFDLEFNQQHPEDAVQDAPKPPLIFEIIQIGAIKLNKNFKTIGKFNSLIKPKIHTRLHPYVEELTKINNEALNVSYDFTDVFKQFTKFIGKGKNTLVVWGDADITELVKNMNLYNLPVSSIPDKYIDIQNHATKHFKLPKGQKLGLKKAVETLEIPLNGDFHDAFFDADYTAKVFKKLYTNQISVKNVNKKATKNSNSKKEYLDSNALIAEFEKKYNRKMTKEEIEMIRLAYFMGKTKQFIIKNE